MEQKGLCVFTVFCSGKSEMSNILEAGPSGIAAIPAIIDSLNTRCYNRVSAEIAIYFTGELIKFYYTANC